MAKTKIRVIQWNICIISKISKIVEFIDRNITEKCIVNLQEVTEKSFNYLKENLNDNAAFSLIHRTPGVYEGKNRKMGVATLCFGGSIAESCLLNLSWVRWRHTKRNLFLQRMLKRTQSRQNCLILLFYNLPQ